MLLLGGTTEARELAQRLAGVSSSVHVVTSLAGRLEHSPDPAGDVRRGGFGGADGITAWLRAHAPAVVVDATHPFAVRISENAAAAASGAPVLRLQRPGWQAVEGDRWLRVPDLESAAAALPLLGRTALVTTGQQGLARFAGHRACHGVRLIARCAEPPADPQPPNVEVLVARGPFDLSDELALLRREGVEVVVTKDSGGDATRAKLDAARRLGLPVVMVDRPPTTPGVPVVVSVAEAQAWVIEQVPTHGSGMDR